MEYYLSWDIVTYCIWSVIWLCVIAISPKVTKDLKYRISCIVAICCVSIFFIQFPIKHYDKELEEKRQNSYIVTPEEFDPSKIIENKQPTYEERINSVVNENQ